MRHAVYVCDFHFISSLKDAKRHTCLFLTVFTGNLLEAVWEGISQKIIDNETISTNLTFPQSSTMEGSAWHFSFPPTVPSIGIKPKFT